MEFVVIILAFFFAILMCLGLILLKWIITQIGATIFFVIMFGMAAVLLLAMGDREHENKE